MDESNPYLNALRRHWPIVVVAVVLGPLFAFLTTPSDNAAVETRYRAVHTLLLSTPDGGQSVGTVSFNQIPLFATTGEVPQRVATKLGFTGPPAVLAAQVQAAIDPATSTFTVTAENTDAERAVALADAFADETVAFLAQKQDELVQARLSSTLGRLSALETQLRELNDQVAAAPGDVALNAQRDAVVRQYGAVYEQYQQLATADRGALGLTSLQRAQPVPVEVGGFRAPQSRPIRMLLAGVVGLVLGLGLIVALDRFDSRVRDRRRAEQVVQAPVIGELPSIPRAERARMLHVEPDRSSGLAEAYRTLRTSLTFLAHPEGTNGHGPPALVPTRTFLDGDLVRAGSVPGALGVLVVTSPSPGDGKTTTSLNLAAAFAETGRSVVLVNADFRRPKLAKVLLDASPRVVPIGFVNGNRPRNQSVLYETRIPGVRLLDLTSPDIPPGDLARTTAELIATLRRNVDVIVVDTPPLSVTAEALEFVPLATAVLLITRIGRTRARSAQRAGELIRFSGAPLLAMALTDTGRPSRHTYRYYGYYSGAEDGAARNGDVDVRDGRRGPALPWPRPSEPKAPRPSPPAR